MCANVYLKLNPVPVQEKSNVSEFQGLAKEILADGEVDYKEAYQLLYWLQDHPGFSRSLIRRVEDMLSDDHLDAFEAEELRVLLELSLRSIKLGFLI